MAAAVVVMVVMVRSWRPVWCGRHGMCAAGVRDSRRIGPEICQIGGTYFHYYYHRRRVTCVNRTDEEVEEAQKWRTLSERDRPNPKAGRRRQPCVRACVRMAESSSNNSSRSSNVWSAMEEGGSPWEGMWLSHPTLTSSPISIY